MADVSILAGATSQSILVDLYVLTTGAPQTALVYNSSGLTAYYSFAGAVATSTAITLATLATVTTAWSSGGFIKLDDTNMPGVYRFDIPNAVIAAAKGREVFITFNGFSGMAARHIKIELTGWDNQDAVRGGMTALPNAVAGASGGLLINGSNSGTVNLAALTVTGSFLVQDGFLVSRSTSNTSAMTLTGNGTGSGIVATSGSGVTGDGIQATAASTNGNGFAHVGTGTGAGFLSTGGLTGNGMQVVGGGTSGDAIKTSATSGHGVTFGGGGTAKHGINATAGTSGNCHGISGVGGDTGHGIRAASGSGATGNGINGTASSTNGNGMSLTGTGTGNGLVATSGSGATGDGVKAVAASTNGNGLTLTKTGSGSDLNASSTLLQLAKTTNITGLNDIAATAIVSSGAITTSGGKVSGVILSDTLTTYTGNTLQTGDSFTRIGAPVGASISADVAAVQSDTNDIQARLPATLVSGLMDSSVGAMAANTLTASALATDAVTEIQAGLSTLDAAGIRSAIGLSTANMDTQLGAIAAYIDTEVGAIYSRIGAPVGASISADVAAVQSDTNDLQTRLPAALVGGRIDASVGAIAAAASNVKKNTSFDLSFPMTDNTTHAPTTGYTVAAQRSIDGAAFGACANSVTEIGNGVYNITLAAADTNGNAIMYRFTATGADDRLIEIITQP